MAVLLGALSAHAQSSTGEIYLPPGFSPGKSIMVDPAEPRLQSGLGSGSPSLSTRVRPNVFSTKDFQLEYSMIMLGLQQKSEYEKFEIFSFRIYSDMRYRIADELILWVSPYLIFRTGSDQTTTGHSRSGTILIAKDASLIWTPFQWWQLRGGILDENYHHSFLLLEDQSFPAGRTTFYIGQEDLGASLVGEQAILTYTQDTNSANEIEATPTLQSAQVEAHYKFGRRNQLKLSAGYWQYDNLTSSIAAESMLNGNTVERKSDTYSVFAYKYQGLEARTRLELGIGPLDWSLYSEAIVNSGAPKGMNTGWSAGNEFVYYGARARKYGLNFEYFHVEPDAAVSAFNAVEFDRSNRNGIMAMPYFKWGQKRQNKFSIRFVTSNLMYHNAPQSDTTQVRVRWETDYEFL